MLSYLSGPNHPRMPEPHDQPRPELYILAFTQRGHRRSSLVTDSYEIAEQYLGLAR
jgi:hypothetical protein